jgi:charged multivesicular body protein 6
MGLLKNTMISLGLTQPGPKITPQDKAILEYVWFLPPQPPCTGSIKLTSSLKVQRDKMKQYQKRVSTSLRMLND